MTIGYFLIHFRTLRFQSWVRINNDLVIPPYFVRREKLRFREVEGHVQGHTANGGKRWEQKFLTPGPCVSLQFYNVMTAKLLLDMKAERHDLLDS